MMLKKWLDWTRDLITQPQVTGVGLQPKVPQSPAYLQVMKPVKKTQHSFTNHHPYNAINKVEILKIILLSYCPVIDLGIYKMSKVKAMTITDVSAELKVETVITVCVSVLVCVLTGMVSVVITPTTHLTPIATITTGVWRRIVGEYVIKQAGTLGQGYTQPHPNTSYPRDGLPLP